MRKLLRRLAYGVGATTATASACVAYERIPATVDPDSTLGRVTSPIITAVRFTRSLRTAAIIAADYRRLFARFSDYDSDDYKAERSIVHQRTADRLLALARAQGAVYVKIGQHVASMNHTVPREYCTKLKLLEDRAAYRPYWQIERALTRQYTVPLNQIFSDIDPIPVAAASLAQVHEAKLRDSGQRVAVKVQYPGLETLIKGDILSIGILSSMLHWVFPFFNADWLVEQFRSNLAREVDFELEADSASRTATMFEHNQRICIPRVHNAFSTKRVLVMDYIDGFRIDDLESLHNAGIDTHAVAHAVIDAFARMIFINGFVHCDPHSGNVMIRPKGNRGDFEVFLLDHGLYRELNDKFRQGYCMLWKGLVLRRPDLVKKACDALGADGLDNLFSIMLLERSLKSAKKAGTDIRMKMTKEELRQLRQDLRESGLKSRADFSSLIERIPEDLFIVFKMNALIRNVNKALGASVNRFKLNARYAVRGLSIWNDQDSEGELTHHHNSAFTAASRAEYSQAWTISASLDSMYCWVSQVFDCLLVEAQLVMFDAVRIAVSWWSFFTGSSKRSSDGTEQDSLQSNDLNLIG